MTFREYLIEASKIHQMYGKPNTGNMRVGQCYWDALPENMVEYFMAQDNGFRWETDPFYSDSALPAFLCWVERHWING